MGEHQQSAARRIDAERRPEQTKLEQTAPDPRQPFHVKFASQILCGQKTETSCMVKEGWELEVDFAARVVIVSRRDAHNLEDSSVVPFENVSFIRYEKIK